MIYDTYTQDIHSERFFDNLNYPMSYSSHLRVGRLGDTSWDDRLITQELKFKVSIRKGFKMTKNYKKVVCTFSHSVREHGHMHWPKKFKQLVRPNLPLLQKVF